MTVSTRRVWRATLLTLTLVWVIACVHKSSYAIQHARRTRADQVAGELLDLLNPYDPPPPLGEPGLRLRRARPDQSGLLTEMERAASEAELSHIFDPDVHPYPTADVTQRWRRLLRDRLSHVRILELVDEPVGFVAFDDQWVLHLGVPPEHTRRGFGSALLQHATAAIFDGGAAAARLWVLTDNTTARSFYAGLGWQETGQRRACEFPPFPEEVELSRNNPAPPRRALVQQRSR